MTDIASGGALNSTHSLTAISAIQAKVTKQHNTAVNMNSKSVHH